MDSRIRWRIFLPARTNPVLRWSRNVFLIIGLLALSYVGFALLDARLYQAEQARRFERALKETNLARAESPAIAVSEGSTLGRIEISSVGLTAMILEGTDEGTLRRAVGHIRGTPLPGQQGNVALAVVDDDGKFIGMITDRDICMAVATRPRLASDILVGEVTSGAIYVCHPTDEVQFALKTMGRSWSERNTQTVQPRRLSFRDGPILDSKLSQGGQSSAWNSRIYWTAQRSGAY